MRFKSPIDEEILIASVVPERKYMFDEDLNAGMTILWNIGPSARFTLDNQEVEIENYLVSVHYKMLSKVGDYADLLQKSPKTLSNLFKKFTDKTPLQIINEHRMREARYQLRYSDLPIQEISDELNFNDVQAFSNFFKKKEQIPPSVFRSRFVE